MKTKYIKEIGIIVSYTWLLIAVYFFEWNAIGVFLSFLLEFKILVIVYWMLTLFGDKKNQRNQPGGNVLMAGFGLALMQYVLIGFVAMTLNDGETYFGNIDIIFNRDTLIAFTVILILYVVRLMKIGNKENRQAFAQENLITQALILTGMNLLAFFFVQIIEPTNPMPILIFVVLARIFLEIYINNWSKKGV